MSQIEKRGLASDSVDGTKTKFLNNQSFRARNVANNADISLFKLNTSDEWIFEVLPKYSGSNIATESFVTTAVGPQDFVPNSEKGAANGVATLDGAGLVPSSQLPSYVDDVLEYADLASFPVTGESGKIYVTLDTLRTYRWSGSVYAEISPSAVLSVNSQTDTVVLDTDDISEGSTNLYYTQARFDSAFTAKSTSDLSEGTNLYFTDLRAKSAAVLNSTAGSETDQAASVSAMKSYIDAQSANVAVETFTLAGGDITNGYIDLLVTADKVIDVTPKGFPSQYPVDDYTLSVVSLKTRITFAGDMLLLQSGDKLKVSYSI
jgi:hypothetical protein